MPEKKFVLETDEGNTEADIEEIKALAAEGNMDGQYALGMSYLYGWEIEQDVDKGYEYLEKAAEAGHVDAMTLLVKMLFTEDYTGMTEEKAFEYSKKASKAGIAEAQFYLGVMYLDGISVEQDYDQAAKWLRNSSNKGFAEARNSLAYLYQEGLGVEKDESKAFKLYRQAAAKDSVNAMYQTACCYEIGLGTDIDRTKAAEYYKMAAENGDVYAMDRLGILYYNESKDLPQNPKESFEWFMKAALEGYSESMYCLGCYYMDGFGVEKNDEEGMKWLNLAKENGCYSAEMLLEKLKNPESVDDEEEEE